MGIRTLTQLTNHMRIVCLQVLRRWCFQSAWNTIRYTPKRSKNGRFYNSTDWLRRHKYAVSIARLEN